MTNRSRLPLFAFLFACLVCVASGSCFVGCTTRTPEEQTDAAERVLKEIGVEPISKPKKSLPNPEEIDPSVVKQQAENPTESQRGVSANRNNSKLNDLIDPANGRRSLPKPFNTVDDPKDPWTSNVKLPRETWEVQYLGNAQVGFLHRKVSVADAGSNVLRHEARSRMRVSLKGIPFEQRVEIRTLEQENGKILRIEGSLELGSNKQSFEGTVKDKLMKFKGEENGQPFAIDIEWKDSYRGPFAVEQSMHRSPLQPRESRTLKYFDPLIRKIIDGRLEASEYILTPTMLNGTKDLLEVRNIGMVGENGSQALLWVDKNGEGFKSLVQANDIMSFRTEPIVAEIFESIINLRAIELTSIPLMGPIDVLTNNSAASVTYRFHHRSEQAYQLFALTDKIGQRISSSFSGKGSDPKTVYVTVFKNGGGSDPLGSDLLRSELAPVLDSGATSASEFVPSNSKRVIEMAKVLNAAFKKMFPTNASNTEKANLCRREIQKNIAFNEFNKRIATVTDSLSTKQANCVDHALLFASICRAIDIPARIALGVKFNRSIEMPAMKFHAWIEIRDGDRWVPMDSTDEAFPTSIDRIKILESNFNAKNPYLDILKVIRILPELEIQILP